MGSRRDLVVALSMVLAAVGVHAALSPQSVPFIANTVIEGLQRQPDVEVDGNGVALVVWDTEGSGAAGTEIAGRIVASDGTVVGAEFQVNDTTANYQIRPSVAGFDAGGFVVVWESYYYNGEIAEDELFVRRFDAGGAPLGDEIRIDDTVAHIHADIAASTRGFTVVWDDRFDVFGRRFDSSGAPLGGEFQVNEQSGTMYGPRIVSNADGAFAVVWEDRSDIDGDGAGILMRRFDSGGSPVGGDLQVNSSTVGDQYSPAIGMAEDGAFMVVWEAYGQVSTGDGAFGVVFDSAGNPVGDEFRVDDGNSEFAGYLDAAGTEDGFVVVWNEPRDEGSDLLTTRARRFDALGVGEPVIDIDPEEDGDQSGGVVASDGSNVIVAWQAFGLDELDIFAQRFSVGATPTPTEPGQPTNTPVGGCAGDCDGNGTVSVAELIRAVNIALGNLDISQCLAIDGDGSGTVSINELIRAVNAALNGC